MHNPLSTFTFDADNIKSVRFSTQYDNESIKLFLRRHVATNFFWLFMLVLLASPALFLVFYPDLVFSFIDTSVFAQLFSHTELKLIVAIYMLGVSYYGIMNFMRWYFDVLIVTNKRVIDIALVPPFNWQVTQAQLEEVQDVRHTQGGIFGIIFNMGNIYIQTAGTSQNIAIYKVPKPNRVHELIIQLLP